MESKFFAEGMQVYGEAGNEKLIQLTWKERTGFIYDASSLEMIESFTFTTTLNEGWGISYDKHNHEFIVSDGSSTLHFWDADSLKEKRRLKVTRQNGMDADELNELEFVKGKVLANVWYEDTILVINPSTGECEKEYGELVYINDSFFENVRKLKHKSSCQTSLPYGRKEKERPVAPMFLMAYQFLKKKGSFTLQVVH